MLAAGLLAKKAVERGLKPKPWVKTSLAPGSKVVTDYYREGRPEARISKLSTSIWSATAAPPASAIAARCPKPFGKPIKDNNLRGRRGAQRQPQFRRPHQSAGAGQLSGFAAAGGGLCAGRTHGYRHGQRVAGRRQIRQARLSARHLAHAEGSREHHAHVPSPAKCSARIRRRLRRRRHTGARCRFPKATSTPGTRNPPTSSIRRISTTCR